MRPGGICGRSSSARACAAGAVAACSGARPCTLKSERTGSIHWTPCDDVQCASLSVPLDDAHPNGRAHHAGARAAARDRTAASACCSPIPAAPADRGRLPARRACVFPPEIRAASTSSRGIHAASAQSPVDCADDLDAFFAVDRDPDTPAAGRAERAGRARRSSRRATAIAGFAVRLDRRDRRTTSTRSGPRWARNDHLLRLLVRHVHRHAVRRQVPAASARDVLDGAVDPVVDLPQTVRRSSGGFEQRSTSSSRYCRRRPIAASRDGGNPAGRVRRPWRGPIDQDRSRPRRRRSRARLGPVSSTSASRARCTAARRRSDARRPRSRRRRGGIGDASAPARRPVHRSRSADGSTPTRPRRCTPRVASTRPRRGRSRASSSSRHRRRRRAALRCDDRLARAAVHVLAGPARAEIGAGARAGRAPDPRRRHDQRSGDALRVGAGTGAPARSGHLLTSRRRRSHRYGRGNDCIDDSRRRLPARSHRPRRRHDVSAEA